MITTTTLMLASFVAVANGESNLRSNTAAEVKGNTCKNTDLSGDLNVLNRWCQTHNTLRQGQYCMYKCPGVADVKVVCLGSNGWEKTSNAEICPNTATAAPTEKMAIAAGRRGKWKKTPPVKRTGSYQSHSWDPLFQKATGKANLQCCGKPGDNPQFSDKIASRKPCNDGQTGGMDWSTANEICKNRGKRLCTAAEAMRDEGAGSGCNFDSHFVWTSTSTNDYANTKKLQEEMNKVWDLYAIGVREYPAAIGGCSDVAGGSGWLTVAKPYTPKQCNDACKDKYPYFTIASGDKNCKCHPSCSSAHHGHTAYASSH